MPGRKQGPDKGEAQQPRRRVKSKPTMEDLMMENQQLLRECKALGIFIPDPPGPEDDDDLPVSLSLCTYPNPIPHCRLYPHLSALAQSCAFGSIPIRGFLLSCSLVVGQQQPPVCIFCLC